MRDACGIIEGFVAKLHQRLLYETITAVGDTDSS